LSAPPLLVFFTNKTRVPGFRQYPPNIPVVQMKLPGNNSALFPPLLVFFTNKTRVPGFRQYPPNIPVLQMKFLGNNSALFLKLAQWPK
jgi:hypothetical protein